MNSNLLIASNFKKKDVNVENELRHQNGIPLTNCNVRQSEQISRFSPAYQFNYGVNKVPLQDRIITPHSAECRFFEDRIFHPALANNNKFTGKYWVDARFA